MRRQPARGHDARSFPPGQEAGEARHFPHFGEYPGRRREGVEAHVGADVEDDDLERRHLGFDAIDEFGDLLFAARVEAERAGDPT